MTLNELTKNCQRIKKIKLVESKLNNIMKLNYQTT